MVEGWKIEEGGSDERPHELFSHFWQENPSALEKS
jgi:hypothetical protein